MAFTLKTAQEMTKGTIESVRQTPAASVDAGHAQPVQRRPTQHRPGNVTCYNCGGSGLDRHGEECNMCAGTGEVPES